MRERREKRRLEVPDRWVPPRASNVAETPLPHRESTSYRRGRCIRGPSAPTLPSANCDSRGTRFCFSFPSPTLAASGTRTQVARARGKTQASLIMADEMTRSSKNHATTSIILISWSNPRPHAPEAHDLPHGFMKKTKFKSS